MRKIYGSDSVPEKVIKILRITSGLLGDLSRLFAIEITTSTILSILLSLKIRLKSEVPGGYIVV